MDKTTQYRQIDFLRLFKLCKEQGIVKRKRKMPTEYKSNNERSAGKRLLHDLVKHLFPNYDIKSDSVYFYIVIPKEINYALAGLASKPRSFFDNAGGEGEQILRKFGMVRQNLGGHIFPAFPYEININVINVDISSRYNQLINNNIQTSRPRDSYYTCALSCIEYAKIWNGNIQALVDFYRDEEGRQKQREAEALLRKKERRQAERLRLEQEKGGKIEVQKEDVKKLKEVVETKEKKQPAQDAFNIAMQKYIRG